MYEVPIDISTIIIGIARLVLSASVLLVLVASGANQLIIRTTRNHLLFS